MEEYFGYWTDTEDDGNHQIRILHVDDDAEVAELASLYLQRESDSFDITTEYSASDALDRLESERFDCIVSDYQMPGKSGLEFLKEIPKELSDIPFILFTGKGSEEIASEAFSNGVSDYLQKEIGPDQYKVLAKRISAAVERYRSSRRLDLTRRRFKTLVEESNDAIFVVDIEGNIHYATPATELILGFSPVDLVGTNGFERIHSDDTGKAGEEFARLVDSPEYRATAVFRFQHADGRWIWVEARGRNLLDNEEIEGLVIYVRDIDKRKSYEEELKQREQKFRAVFDEAFDAMVITDDDGVYVDANPAACELFGLEKNDLLGSSIADFVAEDFDFEQTWGEFQESDGKRGIFQLVRPDEKRRTIEYAASNSIIPHRHLSILRDISDRERSDIE